MEGLVLDLLLVLLLLLSWRRSSTTSVLGLEHPFEQYFEEWDKILDNKKIKPSGDDEFHIVNKDYYPTSHKMNYPRLSTFKDKLMRPHSRPTENEPRKLHTLIRHTARLLKRFYGPGKNDMSSALVSKPAKTSYHQYHFSSPKIANLTIEQLIENLRELRAERHRRSSFTRLGDNPNPKKSPGNPFTRPSKKVAEIDGDIVLGGLMMVHERGDIEICGPVMPQGGIQALEMMLYTVDYINRNSSLLPGIQLGVHILDDCDKDTYGLEQAVEFIKGSISNIDDVEVGGSNKCNGGANGTTDDEKGSGLKNKVISGVVGAASSVTSIQVANLLRLFKIPQVSFFSTSPELSNKQRYDYFARTIPSDKNQVQVMFEIIDRFGWKYVSIIYEESNYGTKALEELERLLPKRNICIAAKEMLVKDSGVAADQAYDLIVKGIQAAPRAKGVIIFGSDQEVKALMLAVRRRNATGSYTWIGSDGWSARTLVSDGNEREVEGTLSVQPRAKPVLGFDQYFFKLNVKNNKRNPWFVEFWEDHFKCKYPNSTLTIYNSDFNITCTGTEVLTPTNTQFEAQLQFVSDAVMAFAYAIKDMHRDVCGENELVLCEKMNPIDGTTLLGYLKNVSFVGLSGDDFHFDGFSDGPARYNIIHFRWVEESNKYEWVRVGEYNEGNLTLEMSKVRFADGTNNPPLSVCSDPCGPGEAKGRVQGSSGSCCWSCIKCVGDQIRHEKNESSCFTCAMGTLPNKNHTKCVSIPEKYLQPSSGWAIGAMVLAGFGILLTIFIIIVFVLHNDTPVVRASGRELSYVLLVSLLLCYALTFLFVIRPNDIICGTQQLNTSLIFTSVYAALLTKTNRIARIFQAGKKSARRPSFISPKSQIIIWFMLLTIQIIVTIVWMLLSPPKSMYHYPTREDNFLVCNSYINASYTIAFAYPILLIVICTVYAVLTRKIPEAFNESKYIGFTMYTTCIIWLAFVPIYFSTANQVALRITSMTVAISLSATVMVACLFAPKLYIIILHPERNVRQSMMPNTNKYSTHTTSGPGGTKNIGPNATLTAPPASLLTPNTSNIQMTTTSFNKQTQSSNHTANAKLMEIIQINKPKLIDCGTQSEGFDEVGWTIPEKLITSNNYTQTEKRKHNNNSESLLSTSSLNTPDTPGLLEDKINGGYYVDSSNPSSTPCTPAQEMATTCTPTAPAASIVTTSLYTIPSPTYPKYRKGSSSSSTNPKKCSESEEI